MNRYSVLFGLTLFLYTSLSVAGIDITISPQQAESIGIVTAPLPNKKSGEVSGLPSQIVVPGNQLFIISTPLTALVEQTLVGVGDHVKKGQPLVRLQSPALAEAQRGLLQASVQYQLTKENSDRDEALWRDGIISESRYRQSRGAALEAQAALAERKQMLKLSGMSDVAIKQLQSEGNLSSSLTIVAPIDGVVLEKSVNAGQRLDGAIPMLKVAKLHPLDIEIQAPLSATKGLKVGAAISIPAFHAKGRLTVIGRSLTGGNQTILLRGVLDQGTENLRPYQVVEASINMPSSNHNQWEIPNAAIARIANKATVFVSTSTGFRMQAVELLNEGAENSVISGPLKGNEKIAIRGVSSLKSSAMGLGGGE